MSFTSGSKNGMWINQQIHALEVNPRCFGLDCTKGFRQHLRSKCLPALEKCDLPYSEVELLLKLDRALSDSIEVSLACLKSFNL